MVTQTIHRIICQDARWLDNLASDSVDLIITSPPYPMIQMWDALFVQLNPDIGAVLNDGSAERAFDLMHDQLDRIWEQLLRLLKPGGLACINVGDATRTVGDRFGLYANHARITECMRRLGFTVLPLILWRKPTNAPTKFMGSGMYPPGAYVTLEHEYILIFRKGGRRTFDGTTQIENRRESAYFWEERNTWFSDVWLDLPGTPQSLGRHHTRHRSAAFPFEIPYRLINMFSVKGDTVLDPFAGTGTTLAAAAVAGRNSVGLELDATFAAVIQKTLSAAAASGRSLIMNRLQRHLAFVNEKMQAGYAFKYTNRHYGFSVMTRQEQDLLLDVSVACRQSATDDFRIEYDSNLTTSIEHITTPATGPNADRTSIHLRPENYDKQRSLWEE